ncbi:hypothetical protein DP107_13595 [Haloglomus irregulare]|uniref:Uncharacterized protein n=1 Tax=Haloglomus irregulare TaxID=2234134 RepID=A0A554MY11_9EURY|nr:hypothetical protein DP107_13595 [Haloglomus irregulare]
MSPSAAPKAATVQTTLIRARATTGSCHSPTRPHIVISAAAVRKETTAMPTSRRGMTPKTGRYTCTSWGPAQ